MKYETNEEENITMELEKAKHTLKCEKAKFAIQFSRTSGIGMGVRLICETCGADKDVTDYSSW